MSLQIKNPHSILAALEARPQDVLDLSLPSSHRAGQGDDVWERIARLARDQRVRIGSGSAPAGGRGERDHRGGKKGRGDSEHEAGRIGTGFATVREREPLPIEALFAGAREQAGGKGLWLALDTLQDPHNVGAIFRTSAFFGIQGILLTEERSAPLSATVYDVASGGMESVPFAMHTNLQRAFEVAKEAGLWILGTSEHANDDLRSIQKDRPWLLVLGNEEKGMRRLTEENCDVLCRISPRGEVKSLNVSVAAGVFISTLAP